MLRKFLVGLALMSMLVFSASLAAAQDSGPLYPMGSISMEIEAVAAGVGVSWGSGKLTFQGKEYPFKVRGLSVGDVGIAKVSARGDVYNLKNASDLAGDYAAATGGIALAKGVKGTMARNQKGVVVDIQALQEGVRVNLGVGGFTIEMK
jgi:hypothetical protein